ncbi:MAG: CHAT domain-containing protein, partial [Hyphomonadaceae bacterium]|nr:CHAT domain-containing protein [Hyphomonadaceae bacterium]
MIRRLLLTGALLCASMAVSAPVTAQPNRPEADAPLSPEVMEDVLEAAERSGQYNAVVMTAEHAYATLPADGDRFGAAQRMLVLYKYDANAKMREASEMARRNRVVDRIYGEGARAAPANRKFELDYYYATYLNASHQVGRSMPLFRSVLADANSASDPSIRFRAFVQYASNYLDMGQPLPAGVILGRARDYIATLPAPAMHQARLQMMTMEMSQRLAVGDEDGVRALWREEAAVLAGADIDDATRVRAGLAAIHYLNRVGDGAGAQAAQQVVARARPRSGQARREIDYALACMPIVDPGDPTAFAADPTYEEKFDGCDELNSVAALQGQMRYAPGYVFELQGKDQRAAALYQTAVDAAERARDSFPVEQRGEFFAGRWQPAYGGLLRVSARAAERRAGGDLVNFYDALIASERARARQFGDQQGETADFGTTIAWARFMDQMAPGHVIVVIASQERHLVVLGFNKTRQRAVVKPLGATMLNARAEWLHRMLKDKSSDPAVLARELDAFSRDTLGEVRELLAGAQRVTIIADGAMTRIPFGLFTAADGGPPLIAGAEVSSALSLRSLRAAPAAASGAGLFGVGDPVFPLPPAPVDYPQDRLLEDARGSRTFGVRDGLLFLEPLPFSRREAVDVAAAFEPAARASLANADALQRP